MTSGMTGNSPFSHMSAHNDILNANPISLTEKQSLVSEVKFRCKAMISSKHYEDAEILYGKAIDVLASGEKEFKNKELAILYSNRSLTRSSTRKYSDAVSDASNAIECDGNYSKGYWRLGAAYSGWEKYQEAIEAYTQGISVLNGADEKAWYKEIEKCRSKAKAKPQQAPTRLPLTSSNSVSKPIANAATTIPKKEAKIQKDVHDDSNIFTKSDAVRGYKIVDGKRTSYFHNEQTDEVKKLIGDIAPKRISTTTTPTSIANNDSATKLNSTSAWNTAGTWEEKDYTKYAQELLTNALSKLEYTISDRDASAIHKELSSATAKVSKVQNVDGHASIARVRGKRRYAYEFSLVIEFKIILAMDLDEVATGSFKYPEIDGTTCDDNGADLDFIDFKIKDCDGDHYRKLTDVIVRKGGLNNEIKKCVCSWADTWHTEI